MAGKATYVYVQALRKRKAKIVRDFKESHGCERCGEAHPATLDLHHPNPAEKHARLRRKKGGVRISGGYFWRDLSFKDLERELAKCEVLCSNCHRKQTAADRGWYGGDDSQER